MKKLYFLLLTLLTTSFAFGQELLLNGNFEEWTSATTPTSWTTAVNVIQETVEIHGGTYSAKQAPTATSSIVQKITGLTPGDAITLTIWYKASGDGSDARIWCKWGNNGTLDSATDAAILQGPNNSYLPNGTGDWTQYTLNLTVPSTANEFNFEVRTYNGGTVYWDDFSFFKTTSSNCDLVLGSSSATCDAITTNVDTYTATLNFTGGGTDTYVITPSSGVVSGDNPSTSASGTITVTGINEGVDLSLSITSANCDLSQNISAPDCVPVETLPIYEPFNYTVSSNLGGQGSWVNFNTGDEVVVTGENLSYSGLQDPTGNAVMFNGLGIDPQYAFASQNSGEVFASFVMKVTDLTAATNTAGGYFAGFGDTSTNFASTVWTLKTGEEYQIGLDKTTSTTNHVFTTNTYPINTNVFVVISYDFATNTSKLWLNPTNLGETTAPTETLSATTGTDRTSLDRFFLRQDSDSETPFIVFDELRVGTTWASVTPSSTAGVHDNPIEGFSMYPNPAKNQLTIHTADNLTKNVQIFNVLGKQVLAKTMTGNTLDINLPTGIYVVKVEEAGKIATQKLMVQ